jgi:peptide/nickel transport system permease protein
VLVALAVLVAVAAMCLLAVWIAPADPTRISVRARLAPPGAQFWLGADTFGQDVASRLLFAR